MQLAKNPREAEVQNPKMTNVALEQLCKQKADTSYGNWCLLYHNSM